MTQSLSDNILCSLYLLVWVATLAWYQYKNHSIDAGTAIISSYVVYAAFSLLSLNDTFFVIAYNPLKLFPYIYLYVMLMIALSPTIYHHLHPPKSIVEPHTRILTVIACIVIIMAILQIPDVISNFGSGILKLFIDSDAGNDAYMEQVEGVIDSGKTIGNIPAIIFNALYDLSIFICFYFMTLRNKNYWIIGGLLFCIILGIIVGITQGGRSNIIMCVVTILIGYMLFRKYISQRINRLFRLIGIFSLVVIAFPVIAITMSRFGENKIDVGAIMNWYIGQGSLYFNNYGLDAGGIRNGDRTIYLVKRAIDPETPKNYMERREKYHQLKIDDYYFYTFVGDFTIDFGPIPAFVIFVVFNTMILLAIRPRDGTMQLYQLLLLYFTMCICMQGGMYLFFYSDFWGMRIIVTLLLYVYLRYHELLLMKFPLKFLSKDEGGEPYNREIYVKKDDMK
ncbi:MAG: oligosaccharide repeat unit polymerase [Prevotella sp.]|nr:oligosaccharide repeat unit polymerase [Prevotella sp.]